MYKRQKDPYVNGKPAAIQNTLGKGKVLKLAYRPQKEELISIIRQFSKLGDSRISLPLPNDVRSVPRTDGSIFIFNTSSSVNEITLLKSCKDRISGKNFSGKITMSPYQMLWLE